METNYNKRKVDKIFENATKNIFLHSINLQQKQLIFRTPSRSDDLIILTSESDKFNVWVSGIPLFENLYRINMNYNEIIFFLTEKISKKFNIKIIELW